MSDDVLTLHALGVDVDDETAGEIANDVYRLLGEDYDVDVEGVAPDLRGESA